MNGRQVLALLIVLGVVGGIVVAQQLSKEPIPAASDWYFYDVDEKAISLVEITHLGDTQRFIRDIPGAGWVFDDETQSPVSDFRWGGIPLLLAGPRVDRFLDAKVDDLARYGLDAPPTVIRVGMDDGLIFAVHVGILTPNGVNQYAMHEGASQVVLVDSSWAEVLVRLVTEPPYDI